MARSDGYVLLIKQELQNNGSQCGSSKSYVHSREQRVYSCDTAWQRQVGKTQPDAMDTTQEAATHLARLHAV